MAAKKVSFFVIIFDRPQRQLVQIQTFADQHEAMDALFQAEDRYLKVGKNRYEVVLLGAESLDALHKTHSRYFAPMPADSDLLIAL